MLKSSEMEAILEEIAGEVAGRAGSGYDHDTHMMPGRVIASAYTSTIEAIRDNMNNNTLLRSLK